MASKPLLYSSRIPASSALICSKMSNYPEATSQKYRMRNLIESLGTELKRMKCPASPQLIWPQSFESLQLRAQMWHRAETLCPNCRFLRNSCCIKPVIVGWFVIWQQIIRVSCLWTASSLGAGKAEKTPFLEVDTDHTMGDPTIVPWALSQLQGPRWRQPYLLASS